MREGCQHETGESELGLLVLISLIDAPWAREEDNDMALDISNIIINNVSTGGMPSTPATAARKRWWKV